MVDFWRHWNLFDSVRVGGSVELLPAGWLTTFSCLGVGLAGLLLLGLPRDGVIRIRRFRFVCLMQAGKPMSYRRVSPSVREVSLFGVVQNVVRLSSVLDFEIEIKYHYSFSSMASHIAPGIIISHCDRAGTSLFKYFSPKLLNTKNMAITFTYLLTSQSNKT